MRIFFILWHLPPQSYLVVVEVEGRELLRTLCPLG
jgi:hypothetical protein